MFRIEKYIHDITAALKIAFAERLLYVGLLGSYLRGEATKDSDIDIMVILDELSVADLDAYRDILIAMGFYEKSCGFICGREEILHWNPLERCQLLHTTKDCYGELADLLPAYTRQDEINYVKESLSNLFHELCHRYVHSTKEHNIRKLPGTYKVVFYIIQNMYYLESGAFILPKRELLKRITAEDKKILETAIALKENAEYDFDKAYLLLFEWCQRAFQRCESYQFVQSYPFGH